MPKPEFDFSKLESNSLEMSLVHKTCTQHWLGLEVWINNKIQSCPASKPELSVSIDFHILFNSCSTLRLGILNHQGAKLEI